jgi:hypothetical protein
MNDYVLVFAFWAGMILSVPGSSPSVETTPWIWIVELWFGVASYLGTVLLIRLARNFIHDVTRAG